MMYGCFFYVGFRVDCLDYFIYKFRLGLGNGELMCVYWKEGKMG